MCHQILVKVSHINFIKIYSWVLKLLHVAKVDRQRQTERQDIHKVKLIRALLQSFSMNVPKTARKKMLRLRVTLK